MFVKVAYIRRGLEIVVRLHNTEFTCARCTKEDKMLNSFSYTKDVK